LCNGNIVHAQPTNYEYILPWWVKGASYQIVNNSNWLPEDGGNTFTETNGYGKTIDAYFWYDGPEQYDVTQVVSSEFYTNVPGIQLSKIQNRDSTTENISIFDYYEATTDKIWFDDASFKTKYVRTIFTQDSVIYAK
jgi:hypothetical protein